MAADLLPQLLTYFFSIAFCQLTGRLLFKLLKHRLAVEGVYTSIFLSALLGFASLTCLYAIAKSGGNTVCWILVLAMALIFRQKNTVSSPKPDKNKVKPHHYLMPLTAIALAVFAYNAGLVYAGSDFSYSVLNYDNALYARLSQQLNTSGLENHIENLTGSPGYTTSAIPYHYFDLWFNALACKLSGLNALRCLYLVTYSHLLFVAVCGLLAVTEQVVAVTPLHGRCAVFLVFTGPFWIIQQSSVFLNTSTVEIPFAPYGEKFAIYYPFALLSVLFYLNRHWLQFLLSLTCLAVVAFSTLPAMLVCCLCFAFFGVPKSAIKASLAAVMLVFGALLLFYVFNNAFDEQTRLFYTYAATGPLNSKGLLLNVGSGLLYDTIGFLANYAPLLVLLAVLAYLRGYKPGWRWLLLFAPVFAGSVAKHTFYNTADNYQLFTNALPLFHVFAAALVVKLLFGSAGHLPLKPLFVGLLGINAALSASQAFAAHKHNAAQVQPSQSYMSELADLNKTIDIGEKLAWIYTQNDVDAHVTGQAPYLAHLAHFNFDPVPVKLSSVAVNDFSSRKQYARLFEMLNSADPFYRFFEKNMAQPGQNPDKLKLAFLRSHNIRYLLLGPGAEMPPLLNHYVYKTVSDKQLGITLAVLDFNRPRLVEKM